VTDLVGSPDIIMVWPSEVLPEPIPVGGYSVRDLPEALDSWRVDIHRKAVPAWDDPDLVRWLERYRRLAVPVKPRGLFFCFHLPYTLSWTQRLAPWRGERYHDRLYSWGEVRRLIRAANLFLVDRRHRQFLPKNRVRYPRYRAFEALDQFVTEYTPLRHFATNIE